VTSVGARRASRDSFSSRDSSMGSVWSVCIHSIAPSVASSDRDRARSRRTRGTPRDDDETTIRRRDDDETTIRRRDDARHSDARRRRRRVASVVDARASSTREPTRAPSTPWRWIGRSRRARARAGRRRRRRRATRADGDRDPAREDGRRRGADGGRCAATDATRRARDARRSGRDGTSEARFSRDGGGRRRLKPRATREKGASATRWNRDTDRRRSRARRRRRTRFSTP